MGKLIKFLIYLALSGYRALRLCLLWGRSSARTLPPLRLKIRESVNVGAAMILFVRPATGVFALIALPLVPLRKPRRQGGGAPDAPLL